MSSLITQITALFPAWALIASAAAYLWPSCFTAARPAIVPLLGIIMLGMGLTLKVDDFTRMIKCIKPVAGGVFFQFCFMPLLAWLIALALGLNQAFTVGLILVGTCPGGTASNVICYLAKGDVALSITMTTCSTLLAVVFTPVLTWLYAGHAVPVPVFKMLVSIFKIVIIPVGIGVMLNTFFSASFKKIKPVFPLVSVAAIVFIIAIVVAINKGTIVSSGWKVSLAVMMHNLAGLWAGYSAARMLGWDQRTCKTIAIEVGMQNSGLAVALAMKYFSAATALPGALFSIWHNLSGSVLAAYWSYGSKNSSTRL